MTDPIRLYNDAYRAVFVHGANDEQWILKCHVCRHGAKYYRLFPSRLDLDRYWIRHLGFGHDLPVKPSITQSSEAVDPFPPAKFGPPWASEIPRRAASFLEEPR